MVLRYILGPNVVNFVLSVNGLIKYLHHRFEDWTCFINASDTYLAETYYLDYVSVQIELSGCVTTLTVRNTEVANFCAAMDTLIDEDGVCYETYVINIF